MRTSTFTREGVWHDYIEPESEINPRSSELEYFITLGKFQAVFEKVYFYRSDPPTMKEGKIFNANLSLVQLSKASSKKHRVLARPLGEKHKRLLFIEEAECIDLGKGASKIYSFGKSFLLALEPCAEIYITLDDKSRKRILIEPIEIEKEMEE